MRYIVEGPDGKRYIVEGPNAPSGAAQPAGSVPSPAAPASGAPEGSQTAPAWARAFGVDQPQPKTSFTPGVADAGIRAYLGAKQLFGGLNKDEQGVLREQEADYANDPNKGTRTTGNILANTALTFMPGGALNSVLGKMPLVLKAALGSGVQSGILTPGKGDTYEEQMADKGKEALKDAAVGGALGAGASVLRKTMTSMFKPSTDATTLMAQGITPTLQQGAEGRVGRFVGGLSGEAADVRHRQATEILDALTQRASNGNLHFQDLPLKDRTQMVEDMLSGEYDKLFAGKRFSISPSIQKEVAAKGAGIMTPTGQFRNESGDASATIANIMGDLSANRRVGAGKLQQDYLGPLTEAMDSARASRVKDALMQARQTLIDKARNVKLSADEQSLLQDIDSRWYDLSRLKDAARGAEGDKVGVNVRKLAQVYATAGDPLANRTREELIGPAMRVIGDPSTQDQARSAMAGIRRTLGLGAGLAGVGVASGVGPALAAVAAPAYAASLAGQTPTGARFMFGQNDWQKKLAEMLRSAEPAMLGSGQYLTGE